MNEHLPQAPGAPPKDADVCIIVEGCYEADIRCGTLIAGPTAELDGVIVADRVEISGCVRGEIFAKEIVLRSTAKVEAELVGLDDAERIEFRRIRIDVRHLGLALVVGRREQQVARAKVERVVGDDVEALGLRVDRIGEEAYAQHALDPELVSEVLNIVRDLATQGMTMLLATHEMGFAREVASKVCFLYEGVVHEEGPPDQFFGEPKEERTRAFLKRIIEAGRL